MTFKQFVAWCDKRTCDGCWGMLEAMACIDIVDTVRKKCFWKREKIWKSKYEKRVLDEIVSPIEIMIKEQDCEYFNSKGS